MFTLALIFAGTNKVLAQALGASTWTITPLSCIAASEPLHPFAGVPYKYILDGASGEEKAATYTWWATKDENFITGPVTITGMVNTNFSTALASPDVINLSTNYGVTTTAATAGANEVEITWSANILAGTDYQGIPGPGTPTFVVGYAEGENCADNIQVFEINPLVNFTIDIAPIDPGDNATSLPFGDATSSLCVDDVQSAIYNAGAIDMDYGINTIYFEVTAANFVTDWTPTFQILNGIRSTQTAVLGLYPTIGDAVAGSNQIGADSPALAAVGATWASGIQLTAADPTEIGTGVSVFVKVLIDNNTEESLTSNPFQLAVDAIDNSGAGIWDMEDDDCGVDPTTIVADQVDEATITVTPRPQLDNATTPNTIPNPDTYILKTP